MTTSTKAAPDLILGTAGHIDHGKSSLILALTGTDPDRLTEEKKRGITIELGFAELVLPGGTRMGVVDVPGHERFVRQMIAGATGIDVALLCIAADDGIMPQTKEHVSVLELLGVSNCVVALTKCDLVDREWLELVKDEVRAYLQTTSYAQSPLVAVSSRTKEGFGKLLAALENVAHHASAKNASGNLRLPVDRSFTIKGAGTVITGTLWSGTAHVGDDVEILPSGKRTRIRSIEVHGSQVNNTPAGHRTALNLNAVTTDEVRPGDMLATPNTLRMSDRFDTELTYLGNPNNPQPLQTGARVHVAHGTKEVVGRVLLMNDAQELPPHTKGLAQIRLDEDLPVAFGDRFVIRSFSPVYVIGGGMVLRAHPKRTTNLSDADVAQLEALKSGDFEKSATSVFEGLDKPVSAEELADLAEVSQGTAQNVLNTLVAQNKAVVLSTSNGKPEFFTTRKLLQQLSQKASSALVAFHAKNPEATGIAKEALRGLCAPKLSSDCFDAVLATLIQDGAVVCVGGELSHPTAGAGAEQKAREAANALLAELHTGAAMPTTVGELPTKLKLSPKMVYKGLGVLEQQGKAVKVSPELYFETDALNGLTAAVKSRLGQGGATAAELRDAMGVSRKYAIPLLEYFDDKKITRREGDMRVLNA